MFSVARVTAISAACLLVCACASTQLNYNALNLASTVDDLVTSQIVFNLGRFLVDPSSNPSQVTIPSGSVTTTNQTSVSVNTPVNIARTATTQAATAAGAVVPAITRAATHSIASVAVTPSANNQASQNWTLNSATDADQERRLGALYRFATQYRFATHPKVTNLCGEYPLIVTQTDKAIDVPEGRFTVTAADSQFLREPSCIICSSYVNRGNSNARPSSQRRMCPKGDLPKEDLYVNPRLKSGWLVATPEGATDGLTLIGDYEGISLYTRSKEDYRQFILFILEATAPGSASGQSGKAQRGTSFVPAAAPTFVLPGG